MDAAKLTPNPSSEIPATAQSQAIKCNQTLSLRDAFSNSLMMGAGESYFAAFVLFLGFSETLTGIFASLPLAIGAALQLLTPWGLRKVGSMRRWVLVMVSGQILSLLLFAFYAGLLGPGSPAAPADGIGTWGIVFIFGVATLYWATGYSSSAVWNRWMADLIHADESSRFFTRRLRSTQYGTLIGLLFAGYILSHQLKFGAWVGSFALVFLAAAASRMMSSYFLGQKDDGSCAKGHQSLGAIMERVWKSGSERDLMLFLFVFGIGVYVSSPFVNPFLLGKLQFGASAYTSALVFLFLGKIVGFTFTHKYLGKWTSEKAMIVGALGIAPLPALWVFATTPTLACVLQAVSGFSWGIYEASLALILFRKLKNESKVALMSLINFIQCAAILVGGLVGGAALKFFGENLEAYNAVFALSAVMRVLICSLFAYTWLYAKGRRIEDSVAPPSFDLKLR